MTSRLILTVAAMTFAVGFGASGAIAQTAEETECATSIEALNTAISSQEGATTQQREEATTLSQQASDAQDGSDYARCVELTARQWSSWTSRLC